MSINTLHEVAVPLGGSSAQLLEAIYRYDQTWRGVAARRAKRYEQVHEIRLTGSLLVLRKVQIVVQLAERLSDGCVAERDDGHLLPGGALCQQQQHPPDVRRIGLDEIFDFLREEEDGMNTHAPQTQSLHSTCRPIRAGMPSMQHSVSPPGREAAPG